MVILLIKQVNNTNPWEMIKIRINLSNTNSTLKLTQLYINSSSSVTLVLFISVFYNDHM